MNQPNTLLRGIFVALALLAMGPLGGIGGSVLGVQPAYAQSQQLIASVLFEGNRRFSDEQLLAMVNLATRGTFSNAELAADIESIRRAYDSAGFTNVSVTSRVEAVQDGRVRVVFVVNEGERAGIGAINFTGNNSISSSTLKGVITTKESGFLSWLLRDDTYDEQRLGLDRELIRRYYANRGYPDTQVTSVGEYDPQRNAYFINFTINEGERYSFGNIGIETSIAGLDANALRRTIQTSQGSRYSVDELQRTTEEMAVAATGQGYSFADVRPRIDRDIANRTFNITYLVDEGARVYVERINITGNTKTRDYVIRRELDFAEGDPFNRSIVSRGRSNIERLGFFSSVEITTEQGSAPDRVVLNVAVVEQSTGEYGASIGYSTAETGGGILGEVSISERNFLGRGQFVRASVGTTGWGEGSAQTFDFSFTEPRFMGLRISSGIDVYHRINPEPTNVPGYGTRSTGGQLRFGLPVANNLTASIFTGFEQRLIADTNNDSALVVDGETLNKGWVGYTLTYNTLDNTQRPREGFYATLSQQYVGIDHNYVRSEARARYFMPLLEDSGIVASVRGQAGIINTLDGSDVRAVEAFNAGPSLVRGFQGRGLGPRLTTGEYLGATMYVGASAELEFPVPVLPESYGLRGAVWADAGWVDGLPALGTGTFDPASQDEPWRTSVGASIIWDSPFGPLRGDFAHVLSQSTDDRTQVFQLTLSSLL